MATNIRATISEKNSYFISKHRYHELRHYCLQYPDWKRLYSQLDSFTVKSGSISKIPDANSHGDPTSRLAFAKVYYSDRIDMVDRVAKETDETLAPYILECVTQGMSYDDLVSRHKVLPCGKDLFYVLYRKFFWNLSRERQ